MGLAMASPYRHPKTGIFWYRRRTPADLRQARDRLAELGIKVPAEVKHTLRTHEPSEAKRRFTTANGRQEERWQAWRKVRDEGPRKLSQKEVFALSAAIGRRFRGYWSDNPGDLERRTLMMDKLAEIAAAPRPHEAASFEHLLRVILPKLGYEAVDRRSLAALVSQYMKDAPNMAGDLAAMADGDYSEPAWSKNRPILDNRSSSLSFAALLDDWRLDAKPKPSTVRTYTVRLAGFRALLGHEDAARVTRADVQAWKERMLKAGKLTVATINDNLAALSALLAWAVRNGRLNGNPAENIRAGRKAMVRERPPRRDYEAHEKQAVLAAARREAGFLRWAPFIAAALGTRVGEIAQLRRSDVRHDDQGQWTVTFDEGAGSTKSLASNRTVPLPRPLIDDEGFGAYVAAVKGERLFPELYRQQRDGTAATPESVSKRAANKMSKFVRGKVGIADTTIGPTHSWRHSFVTEARDHGVETELREAIIGHAAKGIAGRYGRRTVAAMRRELDKLPPLPGLGDDEA